MPRPFNPNTYLGWRRLVFQKDGHACVWCRSTERLESDHIVAFSRAPELRYEVSNGRVLCHECHKMTDTYGAKSKRTYVERMAREASK